MKNYGLAMKEIDWLNNKSKSSERDNQNTEILFIEQCYNFLREGGYLAIVIPDGILTNSSLQYVRDWIEEKFRIIGVISLPQTAFQATGAGVKSSVLFLKKYALATTEKIQEQKLVLQGEIKSNFNYDRLLIELEKEKKDKIKRLVGFDNVNNLEGKDLQNSEAFKEWKKEVNNEFRERIDELKANLIEEYLSHKQRLINDYDIFMAIAEDIGYDATGKATNNNELDLIGEELSRFINGMERGEDSFFLGENVDQNKVFLVKVKDLGERLDPFYHQYKFQNLTKILYNSQFNISKLGNLSKVICGPFGSSIKTKDYCTKGVPLIRISNIDQNGNLYLDDYVFIKNELAESLNSYRVYEKDLIISQRGSLGIIAIIPQNMNGSVISANIIAVKNLKQILPSFLKIYLSTNIGNTQILQKTSGQVQTKITTNDIKSLIIPIPPLEIQNQIVAKMDNAYTSKKEKEAEAQRLLDSIDDYLLRELGIELPQPEENTVKNRIFYRRLSDISGGRFDASAYHKKFSLKTQFYRMEKLSNLVFINPLTRFSNYKLDDLASFIPMENISEIYGEAKIYQTRKIRESEGYTKFLENDLIWAKITPCMENGKSAVVTNLVNNIGFGSTEYHVFRAKKGINIRYIYALLRLKSLRNHAKLYFSGSAGHQRVSDQFFKQLLIPIPPLEKQNKIAENITKIREKAKQLQEEAKRDLEEAKIEVEKMILG